jgi:hypothetical protein
VISRLRSCSTRCSSPHETNRSDESLKLSCISDLYKKWLRITMQSLPDAARSPRPPSTSSSKDSTSPLKAALQKSPPDDCQKIGEIRDNEVPEPMLPCPTDFDVSMRTYTVCFLNGC